MDIYNELPGFVHFLVNWTIPAELQKSEHAGRFGHDAFHHPQIMADLFEQEPESGLLYMIDNEVFATMLDEPPQSWGCNPAMQLHERLTADSCRFTTQAKKLFSYPGACGSLLSRLHEKFPQRFNKKHTNSGNVWMIHPPN